MLEIAGLILGMAGILGAAFAVLRSSSIKTLVEAQKELIITLEKESTTQATIIAGCKERLQAAELTIGVLQDQVTGTTAIAQLTKLVIDQHNNLLKEVKKQ